MNKRVKAMATSFLPISKTVYRSNGTHLERKTALKARHVGLIIILLSILTVFQIQLWYSTILQNLPAKTSLGLLLSRFQRAQEPVPNFMENGTLAFKTAQACLKDSPYAPTYMPPLVFSSAGPLQENELQAHYEDILNITTQLRIFKMSFYANYSGPWMEDYWIKHFCCSRHVREFGGLVPLFVQWNDIYHRTTNLTITDLVRKLLMNLRKDVIYVTVSQNDNGLRGSVQWLIHPSDLPNILVMSAGGVGHIPIPLLIDERPWQVRNKGATNIFSFVGTIESRGPVREDSVRNLLDEKLACSFPRQHYQGRDWINVMRNTKLNFAPRGFGKTSFRLYEAIQMGLVPVYIWDDHEWLPYRNSLASLKSFGFSVHIDDLRSWMESICRHLEVDEDYLGLDERTSLMRHFRDSHYTFDGVMRQIEYFFKGDGRSDLACQVHPPPEV